MTDVDKANRIVAVCTLYTEAEISATELLTVIENILQHDKELCEGCHECGREHGHTGNCGQR